LSASLRMSARLVYMLDVIAFFWAGRFSSTRRMLLVRSVIISLMGLLFVSVFPVSGWFLDFRHRAAGAQVLDAIGVKSQVAHDPFGVRAEVGSTPGRYLGDTVQLNRTADRRSQLAAGAFERNDDFVGPQLRIFDHLLRPAHGAERDVNAAENL